MGLEDQAMFTIYFDCPQRASGIPPMSLSSQSHEGNSGDTLTKQVREKRGACQQKASNDELRR